MALQGYFDNDTTPISLGVEPLTSLYSGAEATGPAAPTPIVRDEGDAEAQRRERLAGILLGLGTFGGYQPPAFLTEELRARSRGRREEDMARRLLALRAGVTEATERRKEQRALAGQERQAEAVRGVRDEVLRSGTEAIDHATQLAFRARMLAAGVPDAQIQDVMKVWATKFEQSKDGKTMIQTWSHGLQAPKQWPMDTVEKLGNSLLRMRGTEVTEKIAEQPEITTLKPGEQPVVKPGVRLPGQPLPKELTPVGPVVPEPSKETPLTAEQRALLATTPFAGVRTFEQLQQKGGGPTLETVLKDADKDRSDRILERTIATLDAREQAKAKASIGKTGLRYIHRETLRHPVSSMATGAVENDPNYVQLSPERIKAVQMLPGIGGNFDELEDIVTRRSDLFPRSTGIAAADIARQKKARAEAWVKGETDPDIARLKSLEIQVPQAIKLYGDTGNISVSERLVAVGSLGLQPNTAESVLAQIDLHRRGLNRTLGPLNVAPYFVIPDRTPLLGSPRPGGGRIQRSPLPTR